MGVTLRDIAIRVGVSAGVVSTVLSGKKNGIGVSLATQLKVREAARDLGYILPKRGYAEETVSRPQSVRRVATAAAKKRSAGAGAPVAAGVVGIVCDYRHLDDFWQRLTLNSLEAVLADNTVVSRFVSPYDPETGATDFEKTVTALLDTNTVQAIVLLDLHETIAPEILNALLAQIAWRKVNAMCVTIRELSVPVPSIVSDQAASGTMAALHLLERGGGKHIHFFAPFHSEWEKARIIGAYAAAQIAGIGADAVTVWDKSRAGVRDHGTDEKEWRLGFVEGAKRFVDEYLTPHCAAQAPDAAPLSVIAASDLAASEVVRQAASAGLMAGRDYLIVGFDNAPESRLIGLTSVHPPLIEMGEEAGRLLVRLMAGERVNSQIRIRSRVIARDSTVLLT